jgi:hypothetical protein
MFVLQIDTLSSDHQAEDSDPAGGSRRVKVRRPGDRIGTPSGVRGRWSARLGLLAVGLGTASCGAPQSEPAEGPVAVEVRAAIAGGTGTFDHAVWSRLLAGGTRDGLVDYRFFQARADTLDSYLARIGAASIETLSPSQLKALLINAYNAYTIRSILDYPAVASIRDIPGVWTDRTHLVGGHQLTLDQIEHNLLRPFFKDPRIHFAVNCASLSCAPLPAWAYDGDGLEAQLEGQSRAFLTDTGNVRLVDGVLEVSRYFDWYGDDFVAEGWTPVAATIPEFIAHYASRDVRAAIERAATPIPLRFIEYDWSLNAAVPPDPGVQHSERR